MRYRDSPVEINLVGHPKAWIVDLDAFVLTTDGRGMFVGRREAGDMRGRFPTPAPALASLDV